MARVLVTGAGGYIGSVLTRMLIAAGHEVVGIDRFFFGRQTLPTASEALQVIESDIRDLEAGHLKDTHAVIDLAALSNDPSGELDPQATWSINHQARVRVAQLAKQAGVPRYILPSSCSVYGVQDGMLDEESPVNPLTTYARANLKAERDVLELAGGSFCVVVLRQATVYGLSPRMRFDLAINGMVKGFFKNGRIPILRDGTQWRPFIHVRDTSHALMTMVDAPRDIVHGKVFNVGSDEQNMQILPLARSVAEAMGITFEYEWYGDPDHRSYRVSFHKIHEALGFQPKFSPSDGAIEVVNALKDGTLDVDDPRTITVSWYKHLIDQGLRL
jgi:nucleoside-diphosphate-sugar epimerase